MPPPQPCSATHYRHEVTGRRIPRTPTGIPSLTCSTAHAEIAQTNCTQQQQQTNQSTTLHPKPTNIADIKQEIDGPPSKRTHSKCPFKPSSQSQPSRHSYHSVAHLTLQLPHPAPLATQPTHIDTQSTHKKAQRYDGPPSKRTRSQYNSNCKICPDHKTPYQTLATPPMQHLPLSAPANHPTLSCNSQSNTPK